MTSSIITTVAEWKNLESHLKASRWVVIADEAAVRYCLPLFLSRYLQQPNVATLTIPSGESSKDMEQAQQLWTQLSALNIDRKAVVISLGGGVVSDLGGFVAAGFKRGLRTVNVPTTLLAMCDASIGGKTGVNFNGVKNLVGVIHLPEAVLIEPEFLNSLPENELHNGFAETIKHALIADELFWNEIQRNPLSMAVQNRSFILRSAQIKRQIVDLDLYDKHARQTLNFGHTVGHGIESLSLASPSPLHHGESVVIGMVAELWLSTRLASLSIDTMESICQWLQSNYRMPTIAHLDPLLCIRSMRQDKKNSDNQIVCTLLSAIGSPVLGVRVSEDDLVEAIAFSKARLAS